MKKTSQYALLASVILGTTVLGYSIGRYTSPNAGEVRVVELSTPMATVGSTDQSSKIQLLAQKLLDAERQLDLLSNRLATAEMPPPENSDKPAGAAEDRNANRQSRREAFEAEMEKLKTTDPAKYAEYQKRQEEREKRREEFAERRKTAEANRDDFFANVNIAYLSEDERKNLDTFVEKYQELRSLFENREDGVEVDHDKARELGMSVMMMSGQIRDSLLTATAKEMGFTDTESSQFTDVIKQIYGATSLEGPGGHGPRGPGGQDGRRGPEGN